MCVKFVYLLDYIVICCVYLPPIMLFITEFGKVNSSSTLFFTNFLMYKCPFIGIVPHCFNACFTSTLFPAHVACHRMFFGTGYRSTHRWHSHRSYQCRPTHKAPPCFCRDAILTPWLGWCLLRSLLIDFMLHDFSNETVESRNVNRPMGRFYLCGAEGQAPYYRYFYV